MQKLVDNGPHPPPGETGARYIIREDGRRINLQYMRAASDRRLEIGDRVSTDGVAGRRLKEYFLCWSNLLLSLTLNPELLVDAHHLHVFP